MNVYPIELPISHKVSGLVNALLADLDDVLYEYPAAQRDKIHRSVLCSLLTSYGFDQLRLGLPLPNVIASVAAIHNTAQHIIAEDAAEVTMYEVGR